MIYLLLCILSSSMIFVIFRIAKNYHCPTTTLITYNYLTATCLGLLAFKPFEHGVSINQISWMPYAIALGALFVAMFFLIGNSAQKAGITITTLANKLSLVFPVLFSIVYFNEQLTTIKSLGIGMAILAVFLSIYRKEKNANHLHYIYLPLIIFIGSGMIDSLIKFVQTLKIKESESALYTISVFLFAFVCSLIALIVGKPYRKQFHLPTLLLGTLLGAANFGSLYFIIVTLNHSGLNGATVFAINNMSVVALTTLLGYIIFKENLNKINFAGITLAIISLYFLL